jgi:hypothetical protein
LIRGFRWSSGTDRRRKQTGVRQPVVFVRGESFMWCEAAKSEALRKVLILIGVVIVTGYGAEGRSASPDKSTGKRLEFRIVMMGEIIDEEATKAGFRTPLFSDETHLGFTDFEASNGETVHAEDCEFRSPEEAKRYFDWRVSRSSKVLTQSIKADSKGKSVGFRAEVLLAPDQKQSAVMWTNGATFRQILSKSLADAMELAKRYGY